jgi:tetratricopeptide (TPR) repeat protein
MESLAPEVPWVWYNRGCYAHATNRQAEAVAAFSALERAPHYTSWPGRDLHAHACHALRRYEEQLEVARRGAELHPSFLYFLEHQAAALAALGRVDEAERIVDKALTVRAQSGTAGLVMLVAAMELRAHGEHDRSVFLAEQAAGWYGQQPEDVIAMLVTPNRGIEWYPNRAPAIGRRLQEEGAALYWAERWEEAKSMFAGLADRTRAMPVPRSTRRHGGAPNAATRPVAWTRRPTVVGPHLFGEHVSAACIAVQLGERRRSGTCCGGVSQGATSAPTSTGTSTSSPSGTTGRSKS